MHSPCRNMEAVFEQEYQKGEISGMYQAMKLPLVLIEEFKTDIKVREEKLPLEGNENEHAS